MGDGLESRSWYRLHLLTWVLVLLVGGALVVENLVEQIFYSIPYAVAGSGWPVFHLRVRFFEGVIIFNFFLLALNIFITLVILASTIFTTESYFCRQAKWHQFSILFILALTTFVALILANAKYDWVRWRGDATWEYIPFFFIAMGLWCVFWTGWRLVAMGFGRISGGTEDG